ncbi:MAG: Amuc_1099 family pilus-like system protein, partial [Chthoniobacterales bacterium]
GDKFSNLEEYIGKTDPTDLKSFPPYYTKLRLLEFVQVPFRLRFNGSPDEGVYIINTLDLKGKTQFLKIGDKIEGTPYKILKYEKKMEEKDGMEIDVSILTIENEISGEQIPLINDKLVNDPTVFAKFKYLWDGSEFQVKKRDSFSIKPEENIKYKLIDISDERAVIKSPQGKDITIPKGE